MACAVTGVFGLEGHFGFGTFLNRTSTRGTQDTWQQGTQRPALRRIHRHYGGLMWNSLKENQLKDPLVAWTVCNQPSGKCESLRSPDAQETQRNCVLVEGNGLPQMFNVKDN